MRTTCALSLLTMCAAAFTAQQAPPAEQPKPEAATRVEPRTVRLEATLFSIRVAPERLADMDAQRLTSQANSSAELQKALSGMGTVTPLYRVDQGVELGPNGNVITLGSNVPFPRGTTTTSGGKSIGQIEYQQVGAKLVLGGAWEPDGRARVSISLELSSVTRSAIDVGEGIKAPVFRHVNQDVREIVQDGKPFVFVNVDGSALDEDGKALAFATRIVIHKSR